MDYENYQEVYFEKYCKTCKYKKLKETLDPCNECLEECVNINSHKPVYWEDKEK